jgi:hypothetical protein
MKRIVLFSLLAFGIVAFASAQHMGRRGMEFPNMPRPSAPQIPAAEQVTVTGNLSIVHGKIAVVSGDTTYYVSGLRRYVGFIDGLKEGAQVKLEGSAYTLPSDAKAKSLRANKLNLNGKDYDLTPLASTSNAPQRSAPQGPPQIRQNRLENRRR